MSVPIESCFAAAATKLADFQPAGRIFATNPALPRASAVHDNE